MGLKEICKGNTCKQPDGFCSEYTGKPAVIWEDYSVIGYIDQISRRIDVRIYVKRTGVGTSIVYVKEVYHIAG